MIFKLEEKMTYNTKQKDDILEVIKQKHTDFTIKDILKVLHISVQTFKILIEQLRGEGFA